MTRQLLMRRVLCKAFNVALRVRAFSTRMMRSSAV